MVENASFLTTNVYFWSYFCRRGLLLVVFVEALTTLGPKFASRDKLVEPLAWLEELHIGVFGAPAMDNFLQGMYGHMLKLCVCIQVCIAAARPSRHLHGLKSSTLG